MLFHQFSFPLTPRLRNDTCERRVSPESPAPNVGECRRTVALQRPANGPHTATYAACVGFADIPSCGAYRPIRHVSSVDRSVLRRRYLERRTASRTYLKIPHVRAGPPMSHRLSIESARKMQIAYGRPSRHRSGDLAFWAHFVAVARFCSTSSTRRRAPSRTAPNRLHRVRAILR